MPDIISRIRLHVKLLEIQRKEERNKREYIAKGIQEGTLKHIEGALRKRKEPATVQQLAKETGLADQTVYRYLQYLSQEEQVEIFWTYGKVGRPKQKYKWKGKNHGLVPRCGLALFSAL